MRNQPIDLNIFKKRRAILNKKLNNYPALISEPRDRYYFTGFNSSDGFLIISKNSNKDLLFLDNRYLDNAYDNVDKNIELKLLKKIDDVLSAVKKQKTKKCFFQSDILSYDFISSIKDKTRMIIMPIKDIMTELKSVKDGSEIETVKKSILIADRVYKTVIKKIRINITEEEISSLIKTETIKYNCRPAFEPIVAFGKNSAYPHYTPQNIKLKRDMPVLIDFGVSFNNYNCDITRSFWFGNNISELYKRIYKIVLSINKNIIYNITKKDTFIGLQKKAMSMCGKYEENFLHSLGHSIGLSVHEEPYFRSDKKMKKGFLFTIEPGLYIKDKFGVRIEDTVYFNGKSAENLTAKISKREHYE